MTSTLNPIASLIPRCVFFFQDEDEHGDEDRHLADLLMMNVRAKTDARGESVNFDVGLNLRKRASNPHLAAYEFHSSLGFHAVYRDFPTEAIRAQFEDVLIQELMPSMIEEKLEAALSYFTSLPRGFWAAPEFKWQALQDHINEQFAGPIGWTLEDFS